jgi:hypothetical protein
MSGESSNEEHWIQVRSTEAFRYLYERLFHALLELLLVNADHFAAHCATLGREETNEKAMIYFCNFFEFEIIKGSMSHDLISHHHHHSSPSSLFH